MQKTAIITGTSGQVGYYLAKLLLSKGLRVFGVNRSTTARPSSHTDYHGVNYDCLLDVIAFQPEYFFNCAGFTSVWKSWDNVGETFKANVLMVAKQLDAIVATSPDTCYVNCGSVEEFGGNAFWVNETSLLNPGSPYASSKVAARNLIENYASAYELTAFQNWLGNCESVRRSEGFVTKKIAAAVAQMAKGTLSTPLTLGQVDNLRDWSHAFDVAHGIWLSAQEDCRTGLVLGQGISNTVRAFLEAAMRAAGVEFLTYPDKNGAQINYYRLGGECELLCTTERQTSISSISLDTLAARKLGFKPCYSFLTIVEQMVEHEKKALDKNQ